VNQLDRTAPPAVSVDTLVRRVPANVRRRALVYAPLAIVAVVGAAKLLSTAATPFATGSDDAVTEMMVRRATSLDLAYGPYSRFGWRHPGPLFFYFLAPFHALLDTRGLFLGTWVVNVVAAILSVSVVRRRAGDDAAVWTSAVVSLLLAVSVTTAELWLPWNPAVLTVPLVLAAVLAAGTWAGSRLSFAGTLIVVSFLVQAHIGTALIALATVVVATVGLIRDTVTRDNALADVVVPDDTAADAAGTDDPTDDPTDNSTGDPTGDPTGHSMLAVDAAETVDGPVAAVANRRIRWTWIVAVLVLVVFWLPSMTDFIRSDGENLKRIAAFVGTDASADTAAPGSTGRTFATFTRRIPVFPLGADPWQESTLDDAPLSVSRLLLTVAFVALAGLVFVRARNRVPFAAALGAWTIVAYPAAWLSVDSIREAVQIYLVWWLAAVPVPAVIGAGVLFLHWWGPQRRSGTRPSRFRMAAWGVCAVPALVLAVAVVRAPDDPRRQWPVGPTAADLLLQDPTVSTAGGVRVVPSQDSWQENAAFAAALERRGVRVTVADEWLFMFSDLLRSDGEESVSATVLGPYAVPTGVLGPDARDIGPVDADDARLWVSP
jgi:hypothetical protein